MKIDNVAVLKEYVEAKVVPRKTWKDCILDYAANHGVVYLDKIFQHINIKNLDSYIVIDSADFDLDNYIKSGYTHFWVKYPNEISLSYSCGDVHELYIINESSKLSIESCSGNESLRRVFIWDNNTESNIIIDGGFVVLYNGFNVMLKNIIDGCVFNSRFVYGVDSKFGTVDVNYTVSERSVLSCVGDLSIMCFIDNSVLLSPSCDLVIFNKNSYIKEGDENLLVIRRILNYNEYFNNIINGEETEFLDTVKSLLKKSDYLSTLSESTEAGVVNCFGKVYDDISDRISSQLSLLANKKYNISGRVDELECNIKSITDLPVYYGFKVNMLTKAAKEVFNTTKLDFVKSVQKVYEQDNLYKRCKY